MPTFPRLGRHSNRSHNALEQTAAPNAAGAAHGGGTGEAASNHQSQLSSQSQSQNHSLPSSQHANQNLEDPQALKISLPPTAGGFNSSSDSFVDQRQQPPPLSTQQLPPPGIGAGGAPLPPQHQHQHQQNPYGVSPDTAAIDSPIYDSHQHGDYIEAAVARSQSQRYSTYAALPHQQYLHQQRHLQHQHSYSTGSASLEDLPGSAAGYQQGHPQQAAPQPTSPAPVPEKKSRRKLIKGIFSSSNRSNNDSSQQQQQQEQQQHLAHQQQQHPQYSQHPPYQQLPPQASLPGSQAPPQPNSYDNTAGLARRPSKRVSNPPPINTRLAQEPQQFAADRDWPGSGSYSLETSPLHSVGEVDDNKYSFNKERASDRQFGAQDSQGSLNTTIRQVHNDPKASPYEYDEGAAGAYHPRLAGSQPLPPPPHLHQNQTQQAPGQSAPVGPDANGPPPPHHAAAPPHQQQHQQQQEQLEQQQPAPHPQQPHVHQQQQQHQQEQQPHRQDLTSHAQQLSQQEQSQTQTQQTQYQYAAPVTVAASGAAAVPPSTPGAPPQTVYQQPGDSRATANSHLGPGQPSPAPSQNPETASQVSRDSPATDNDQSPAGQRLTIVTNNANSAADQIGSPSSQVPQSAMAPPSGAPPANRGEKPPPGPPPGYRHSNTSGGAVNLTPGAPGSQNPAFRGDGTPRFEGPGGEQGRHSPQPDRDEGEKAFKDLLTKYKNVKRLYFDGKSQIENLSGQVEQLQNAVANQRMSQSRTALDDSEYATRFNRLNGAINNLSFNIRKDWRRLPPWLSGFVSADALKTGKQEMTAVGRAVISRWIVEQFFNKCFHPGLDPLLSAQLKEIEINIRGNTHTLHSQEEFNALTTKIVNWRMATLDGLHKNLNATATAENRQSLISKTTSNLTAWLYQFLNEPPPAGVEGSTSMIVELAVGIAGNLPLESRDVAIMYPLPGDVVRPELMEVEKMELPALELEADTGDSDSEDEKDKSKGREKVKSAVPKDNTRVRFAGFPAWEVRGRQILMKAPVWTV